HHHLGTPGMADKGRLAGVVHGIGEVAGEDDVHAQPDHLPDAEGPAQHAHVGLDTHYGDILDPFLDAEVVELVAAVADPIEAEDVDPLVLPGVAADGGPNDGVVAGALRGVHGQGRFALRVEVAPARDGDGRFSRPGLLHALAIRG